MFCLSSVLEKPNTLLLLFLSLVSTNIESIGADLVTVPTYSRYGNTFQTTCNREPQGVTAPQTKGNNGFKIKLSGNPEKYVPGEMYTGNVILHSCTSFFKEVIFSLWDYYFHFTRRNFFEHCSHFVIGFKFNYKSSLNFIFNNI